MKIQGKKSNHQSAKEPGQCYYLHCLTIYIILTLQIVVINVILTWELVKMKILRPTPCVVNQKLFV
jgi:hypothetical protein